MWFTIALEYPKKLVFLFPFSQSPLQKKIFFLFPSPFFYKNNFFFSISFSFIIIPQYLYFKS